ncbi:MAG: alpha/beta fold hydrolase [Gammaproteobacteria bacterium]|nr:alpha/beta fold hydrolase [Gammaproteobacteria bacterium]
MNKNIFSLARRVRPVLIVLVVLMLFGISAPGRAETLRLQSPDGKYLNAEYHRGDTRRPALLVLHGFLQTNEFHTTQGLISNFSMLGYTVIGPNFSLGISDRRQSMQCQAPHNHSFEDDLREIDFWVGWLKNQGYSRVIIVGHSWGSQHALGYVEAYPQAPVAAVIAVSLVRTEQAAKVQAGQVAKAQAREARRDTSLQPYALSFCKTFMATPRSYLSYAHWDDKHVIDSLARLQERKLPVYAVIGSKDNRIDDEWLRELRRNAQVSVIEGANHFFSSIHEFDLSDRIEALLTQVNATLDGK